MCNKDHSYILFFQRTHDFKQTLSFGSRQRGCRLIQDKNSWIHTDSFCNFNQLLFSRSQCTYDRIGIQTDIHNFHVLQRLFLAIFPVDHRMPARKRFNADVLGNCQIQKQTQFLVNCGNRKFSHFNFPHLFSIKCNRALCRFQQAYQHILKSRFSRSILTEQCRNLSLAESEVNIRYYFFVGKRLRQFFGFKNDRAHTLPRNSFMGNATIPCSRRFLLLFSKSQNFTYIHFYFDNYFSYL